jgi:pimeloyl-ACP methyl ester carboxylesterase
VGKEGSFTRADGLELAYLEVGDPAGSPILYHHGTPGSRLEHHPDERVYLDRGIRWIAYDRPGYGRSGRDRGRRVASAAVYAEGLADHLGLERFGLMGVSGGGPHTLACAALLPGRVTRAAVLVGAAPSDASGFDFLAGMAEVNLEEFGAALEGEEAITAILDPQVETIRKEPDALLDALASELPAPDQAMLARPEVRAIVRDSFVESVRQGSGGWVDDDLAFAKAWGFELAGVPTEVRLWQGDLDVLVPRSHAEYLAAHLPCAEFELVPEAGHLLLDHWPTALDWLLGGAQAPR